MGVIFWWMLVLWAAAFASYLGILYLINRRWQHEKKSTLAVPIAHSDHLTNLPEYRSALIRYKHLLRLSVCVLAVGLLAAMLLSARPALTSVITPTQKSRDIMLCLDVSGSLLRVDTTVVNRFNTLVNNFSGQRFGMTVFNSSAISIIPLTDDYQLINSLLVKSGKALSSQKGQDFTDITSGTLADFDKGTSLVGDGLMSCLNNMGENPQKRSQSIILATDNESNGKSIVELKKAAAITSQRDVRLYAIDPAPGSQDRAADHQQLKEAAVSSGGEYYQLGDKTAVNDIINDISEQEAKYAAGAPTVVIDDKPEPFFYIVTIMSALAIGLAWRLRI